MKRLVMFIAGVMCTLSLGAHAWALECDSTADCPDGQLCEMADCPAIACDPDDADCVQPDCPESGECTDEGSNGGWESTCETDADCPAGFACEVVGGMSTTCPAGEDCDPVNVQIYGCKPAPCDTDADCAGELVCVTETIGCDDLAMGVPDCAGEDCPPEEEVPPCEPTVVGKCGPKWAAPCEVSADCGEGFECIPEVYESCSSNGSDGTDPATDVPMPPVPDPSSDEETPDDEDKDSGDEDGMPAQPGEGNDEGDDEGDDDVNCETVETGQNICKPLEVVCNTDEDCTLEGWTCRADKVSPVSVACPPDEEDCEPEPEEPVASEGLCVPPGWDAYGGGSGGMNFDDKTIGNTDIVNEEGQGPQANTEEPNGDSSDDGGCNTGQSQGGLFLSLLVLFLAVVTRRREVQQS
jgi:hypothetical protein